MDALDALIWEGDPPPLRSPVLASDIDSMAVTAARENVWRNGAGPLIEVVRASGLAAARIRTRAPYDLVLANILL